MGKPKLTLYYDLHSPYSYLAFYMIRNSPTFSACEVTYTPILLVAYIKAIGLQPPWSSPNKVKWLETDMARWCHDCNIPWKQGFPENYPFKATTIKVQRALVACALECPEHYPEVLSALYHAFWHDKQGVQLPEVHSPIIAKVVGEEMATRIMERSTTEEVKLRLRQNTEESVQNGSTGLPWIKAVNEHGQEEFFWGFDHLGQLVRFLGLQRLNTSHL